MAIRQTRGNADSAEITTRMISPDTAEARPNRRRAIERSDVRVGQRLRHHISTLGSAGSG